MSKIKVHWATDHAYRDVCISAAGFSLTYNGKHASSGIKVSQDNTYSSILTHAIHVEIKDLDTLIEAMVKMKELIQQGEHHD